MQWIDIGNCSSAVTPATNQLNKKSVSQSSKSPITAAKSFSNSIIGSTKNISAPNINNGYDEALLSSSIDIVSGNTIENIETSTKSCLDKVTESLNVDVNESSIVRESSDDIDIKSQKFHNSLSSYASPDPKPQLRNDSYYINSEIKKSDLETPMTKSDLASVTPLTSIIKTPNSLQKSTFKSPKSLSRNAILSSKYDGILSIERILNYCGGPVAYIYNGNMIVMASGNRLVLIDVSENSVYSRVGFWKLFSSADKNKDDENENEKVSMGYSQRFVRGHTNKITLIEVTANFTSPN